MSAEPNEVDALPLVLASALPDGLVDEDEDDDGLDEDGLDDEGLDTDGLDEGDEDDLLVSAAIATPETADSAKAKSTALLTNFMREISLQKVS